MSALLIVVRQCKKTTWAYSVKTDSSPPEGLDICLSFVGRGHHYAWGLSLKEMLSLPNVPEQGDGWGSSQGFNQSSLQPRYRWDGVPWEIPRIADPGDAQGPGSWYVSLCQKRYTIHNSMFQEKISWHEWYNLICVNIGYPDQTRHLKCSS